MKVVQAGYAAVPSPSLSEQQEALLAAQFRQVVVILDGDEAGQRAAEEIAGRLAQQEWLRTINLSSRTQPDQCSPEELQQLLAV